MLAKWYLVKYVRDLFRNETLNVGVVVSVGNHGLSRFVGEVNGEIDGRRVRGAVASVDTLKAWVNYVRHHLNSGSFEDQLDSLASRGLDNYRIEQRGSLLEWAHQSSPCARV